MQVTTTQWVVLFVLVVGLMALDLAIADHRVREFTAARAWKWILFYVSAASAFGAWVYFTWGGEFATQYVAGYITEYSLSIDNLFVFLVILTSFQVPKDQWHRVLLIGIAIALVLRGLMILAGAALIHRFVGTFIVFGIFLIWTAWHVGSESDPEEEAESRLITWVKRIVPVTEEYHGNRLTLRVDSRRHITPLALVMIAIGTTDLLFALDSIPAILGLTNEPYLVLASNAFALMGLRQLFFIVQGLIDRLIFLSRGLAVVLAFIGVKLILEALHELWFPALPTVSTATSLLVILGVLLTTAFASLAVSRRGMR